MKTKMKFSDLNFQPHPNWPGIQSTHFFDNGYGVSVIQSPYSYGGGLGLYELAILRGDAENYKLCYDTVITDDVLGHLSEEEVEVLLYEVENL
jgi:hypothetical protein